MSEYHQKLSNVNWDKFIYEKYLSAVKYSQNVVRWDGIYNEYRVLGCRLPKSIVVIQFKLKGFIINTA